MLLCYARGRLKGKSPEIAVECVEVLQDRSEAAHADDVGEIGVAELLKGRGRVKALVHVALELLCAEVLGEAASAAFPHVLVVHDAMVCPQVSKHLAHEDAEIEEGPLEKYHEFHLRS